ncbi:major facilitator superfamily MFS_1 [Sulfobacillus acidophilus TPY]|nr:major facilitator superfamily MFS_1 [Sulfobacillus acidophilus TPY]
MFHTTTKITDSALNNTDFATPKENFFRRRHLSAFAGNTTVMNTPYWYTRTFWTLALGLFLNAYVFGVSAVALTWIPDSRPLAIWLLIWSPLWLSVGVVLGGWWPDSAGRRQVLRWGPFGYALGALLLWYSDRVWAALTGSGFLMVTAGIDSNVILTYSRELLPPATRRAAMFFEINFVNLGGLALAAAAFWGGPSGIAGERHLVAFIPALLVGISLILRWGLPESILWKYESVGPNRPGWQAVFSIRFLVAVCFAFANTTGFSLLSYAYGAEFLPRYFRMIFLVSTATAFMVGLWARLWARIPPRLLLAGGYGLATAAAYALYRVVSPTTWRFWLALFFLSAMTSITYLAEDTFKTGGWPSRMRARLTSAVRVTALLGDIGVLLATHRTRPEYFLRVMIIVWAVGWMAALLWWRQAQAPEP